MRQRKVVKGGGRRVAFEGLHPLLLALKMEKRSHEPRNGGSL